MGFEHTDTSIERSTWWKRRFWGQNKRIRNTASGKLIVEKESYLFFKGWVSMECVIFIGIQASGKSTFYRERFFQTHMRINLDMLRTRNRENLFIQASLEAKQPFVIDNTNPTMEERQKYIGCAKEHRFKVIGYFFEPDYALSLERNGKRTGKKEFRKSASRVLWRKCNPHHIVKDLTSYIPLGRRVDISSLRKQTPS